MDDESPEDDGGDFHEAVNLLEAENLDHQEQENKLGGQREELAEAHVGFKQSSVPETS